MNPARMKKAPAERLDAPRFKKLLIAGLRGPSTARTMDNLPAQGQRCAPHMGQTAGPGRPAAYGVCWQLPNGQGMEYMTGSRSEASLASPTDSRL
jgi:hypothetical protein